MSKDKKLFKNKINVLSHADKYRWIHQSSWLGEPILNLPQDLFAIQEIIWRSKPEYIIEIGVAWGGSLLFQAMLMDYIGGKKIIGVDIYIPNDLKRRIYSHKKLKNKIELIEGSSIENETVEKVKKSLKDQKNYGYFEFSSYRRSCFTRIRYLF